MQPSFHGDAGRKGVAFVVDDGYTVLAARGAEGVFVEIAGYAQVVGIEMPVDSGAGVAVYQVECDLAVAAV